MAFDRPTLSELVARAIADIETRLPGADARARRSNLAVLARTQAGAAHGLYGYLDWLSRQVMVDTAEAEHLARHAAIWGIDRAPATYATGLVTLTGTTGAVVPGGTVLRRSDGAEYTTDADATLVGGTAAATVSAVTPGAAGNADAGISLSLVTTIAGVQSAAAVDNAGIGGGADTESDASLRERLLARIQRPPQGGARRDYEAWAKEIAGVTRVWVVGAEQGLGTVTVRIATDDAATGPIPDAATVDAVAAHIDALRPVTADVYVVAPIAAALDLTIALSPDAASVRAAVEAEIADMLRRDAAPGATIRVSRIREAISIAAGETYHELALPDEDVTHAAGEMAVLGEITWVVP